MYVSAAAGGVGTAVGRIARLLGAGRIVGSAGSAAKVAPSGIDTYVDNVGGDHLEAAIA